MLRHAAKSGIKRGLTDTCKGAMRASRMNFAGKEDSLQVSDHHKTFDNRNTCGMRTCNSNFFSEQTVNRLSAGFSNSPTFHSQVDVSKSYNGITNQKMEEFLTRQKLVYKVRANGQIVIKECPFCSKPHNNKVSNLWTLDLKENSGAFLCFRCGTHGSWYDFVRHILGDTVNFDKPMSSAHLLSQPIFPNQTVGSHDPLNEQTLLRLQEEEELRLREEKTSLVIEDLQSAHQNMLHSMASLRQLEAQTADTGDASAQADGRLDASGVDLQNLETLRYLISKTDPGARHLSEETLAAYKIGIGSDVFKTEGGESTSVPTITFPLFRPTSKKSKSETDCNILDNQHYDCVRAKVRGAGKENKHFQRFKPSGGQIGFFGLNLLRPDCKVVVLTEGEFDAMAVFEATGLPAISLPNGASNLPTQLIAHLERVERVYLWMDNDEAGQLNVESFANKLGLKRTYIVHTDLDIKDANDALRKDPRLVRTYIEKATPILSKNLIRFENIREAVKNRILKREVNCGVKSSFFPWFNRMLKGFRKGEFTVFTGPTGSGKTTFLSQLSLDFAKSGVPTLWCSFELKNEVLVSSMLNQFAGMDLLKEPHRFDYYADQFENIPLYFQTYFGSTHVDDVVSMIDYAVYTHDISHVVIDNLQFMLSGQGRGIERFDLQDDVVSKLRKLATSLNIHITLVIHPRKGEEGQDLTVSSIFGTAKSTQEADNVIILQQREKYRVIDVKKNRYDGEVGKSSLWFDKGSKRFEQITPKEIEELLNGAKIQDIIERKGREIKLDMMEIANEGVEPADDHTVPVSTSQAASNAYLEANKSQGQITSDNLVQIMNQRGAAQTSSNQGSGMSQNSNYSSAFNKLDKIKLSVQKAPRTNEPQVVFTQIKADDGRQQSRNEASVTEPSSRKKVGQTQKINERTEELEKEYEDMFEVKFAEGNKEIDYDGVKMNAKVSAESKSEDTYQVGQSSLLQNQKNEAIATGIKDPRMSVLLGMQKGTMPSQEVTSMYDEGTVVVTYDQMVEELLESSSKSKKDQAFKPRKETESSVTLSVEKSSKAKESQASSPNSKQQSKKKASSKNGFLSTMFPNLYPSEST